MSKNVGKGNTFRQQSKETAFLLIVKKEYI